MPDAEAGRRRLAATVLGRVQGVGFRVFVAHRAAELGLVGWVANAAAGQVTCVAEGPAGTLEQLLASLRDGPSGASVDRVEVIWSDPTGEFDRFSIRSGWHGGD